MSSNCSTFGKRRSYISLVRKHTNRTDSTFTDLNLGDMSSLGSEWKSPLLENSVAESRQYQSQYEHRRRVSSGADRNKENVSNNRGIIRIKPKKMMGNYHLMWCKERANRSELIKLEREEMTAYDME